MSTINETLFEKETLEEQIHTMLEKVLIDETDVDFTYSEQKTDSTGILFTEMDDEFSSLMDLRRKSKKAYSSINRIPAEKIKFLTAQNSGLSQLGTHSNFVPYNHQNVEMLRGNKKFGTYAYNQGTSSLKFENLQNSKLLTDYELKNQLENFNLNDSSIINYSRINSHYDQYFMPQEFRGKLQGKFPNLESEFEYSHFKIQPHSAHLFEMRNVRGVNPDSNSTLSLEIEEFVENLMKNQDIIDEKAYRQMKGLYYKIITTQNGSRILQKCLRKTCKEILSLILDELTDFIQLLLVEPYANYFFPKFFVNLKKSDRIRFLILISPFIVETSRNKIGTYPIQGIIEQLCLEEERLIIIRAIKDDIYNLCLDAQAVHVIEKIITCFNEEMIESIYELILKNFSYFANNCNGINVIKRIIIHYSKISKVQKEITNNCLILVQNPYGNYAIQLAIDHWKQEFLVPIFQQFYNKFWNLSMQKFSSNVIEKCFEKGGENVVNQFIEEITINSRVVDLVKNSYGNYVVQKALKVSSGHFKLKLVSSILANIEKVGNKKLILKWKTIIDKSIQEDFTYFNNKNYNLIESQQNRMSHSNNNIPSNYYNDCNMIKGNFFIQDKSNDTDHFKEKISEFNLYCNSRNTNNILILNNMIFGNNDNNNFVNIFKMNFSPTHGDLTNNKGNSKFIFTNTMTNMDTSHANNSYYSYNLNDFKEGKYNQNY